ncbi:MAG: hypothetical protein M4579_001727 [Chaenotheca gracillima]|nr:MAG: hypothetical protein M4579_001727 [Chaenotheca gracillima]
MSSPSSFASRLRAAESPSRLNDGGHELSDEDLSRPSTISLDAFAKVKVVSRSKRDRYWRHIDMTGEDAKRAKVSKGSKSHQEAVTPEFRESEDEIDPPKRSDNGKGRSGGALPHPLRQELTQDSQQFADSARLARIEAQFDIEEWNPDLPSMSNDPTVLESMSLTPHNHMHNISRSANRSAGLTQSFPHLLSSTERAEGVRPLANMPTSIQSVGQGDERDHMGRQSRISDDPFGEDASPKFGTSYHFRASNGDTGKMDFDFRFPTSVTGENSQQKLPRVSSLSSEPSHLHDLRTVEQADLSHELEDDMTKDPESMMIRQNNIERLQRSTSARRKRSFELEKEQANALQSLGPESNLQQSIYDTGHSSNGTNREDTTPNRSGADQTIPHEQTIELERLSPDGRHWRKRKQRLPKLNESSIALPWTERPVDIHTVELPQFSREELGAPSDLHASQMPETNNPDLTTISKTSPAIDRAEEWWNRDNRGNAGERSHLAWCADNERFAVRQRWHSGRTTASAIDSEQRDFKAVDTTFRLVAPVLLTLLDYRYSQSQVGGFRPFSTPPQWMCDEVNGRNSFFGDDEGWRAPPARLGRDPRHSDGAYAPRSTGYPAVGYS